MTPGLHVITSQIDIAAKAAAGGAGVIQYRDKDASPRVLFDTAREMLAICRAAGVPLVINDRPDIAMIVGADGVHLGQRDLPIAVARRLLGPGKLIGGSASTVQEAGKVERAGADYVGFGHIFATGSKTKAYPPRGLTTLREVCATVRIPVIAIGGITEASAEEAMAAGAYGVAVLSAVGGASDPEAATRTLGRLVSGTESML